MTPHVLPEYLLRLLIHGRLPFALPGQTDSSPLGWAREAVLRALACGLSSSEVVALLMDPAHRIGTAFASTKGARVPLERRVTELVLTLVGGDTPAWPPNPRLDPITHWLLQRCGPPKRPRQTTPQATARADYEAWALSQNGKPMYQSFWRKQLGEVLGIQILPNKPLPIALKDTYGALQASLPPKKPKRVDKGTPRRGRKPRAGDLLGRPVDPYKVKP